MNYQRLEIVTDGLPPGWEVHIFQLKYSFMMVAFFQGASEWRHEANTMADCFAYIKAQAYKTPDYYCQVDKYETTFNSCTCESFKFGKMIDTKLNKICKHIRLLRAIN